MSKNQIAPRSITQLIEEGYLVPNPAEPNYLEQPTDDIEIRYTSEVDGVYDEAINHFCVGEENTSFIDITSPNGPYKLNDYFCNIGAPLFRVFKKVEL